MLTKKQRREKLYLKSRGRLHTPQPFDNCYKLLGNNDERETLYKYIVDIHLELKREVNQNYESGDNEGFLY